MTDFYDILGVDRDATTEQITTAYRLKAKTAHPDKGGSAEAFSALNDAHSTLSDPDLRAHYDATGKVKERDDITGKALQIIGTALANVIEDMFKRHITPNQGSDFIAVVRTELQVQLDQCIFSSAQLERRLSYLAKVRDGLVAVPGKENRIAPLLSNMERHMAGLIANLKSETLVLTEAISILSDHAWQSGRAPQYTPFRIPTWQRNQ